MESIDTRGMKAAEPPKNSFAASPDGAGLNDAAGNKGEIYLRP